METSEIIVYGAHWCPDCRRAKKFLGENFVPFHWVDIEQDPAAEDLVIQHNQGKRIIPTIVFPDGSFLAEPSNADLARKLGLKTEARQAYYDLLIIGGGPAGLSAAIYAAREGVDTLLIERSGLGGQAGLTGGIDNFPGFPEGIGGQDFADRVVQQARRFEVEILQAVDVAKMDVHGGYQCLVDSEERHYHGRAALIASGASYRRLGVPGEDAYIGAGIHFCATCDGPFYKGADELVVIGGGNSALEESLHLTRFAGRVTLLVRGSQLKASQILIDKVSEPGSRIDIHYNSVVEAFEGQNSKLASLRVKDLQSGLSRTLHPAAAFVFIGLEPNTWFARGYLDLDPYGYILTGHDLLHSHAEIGGREPFAFETSAHGVFAAGDVRAGSTKQVAAAVGEGAAAAISIREYLKAH
jgi:thioredoxin reductase (NADPH)